MDDTAGKRLDNPFYHIAQAFAKNGDGSVKGRDLIYYYYNLASDDEDKEYSEEASQTITASPDTYELYENITVNVWL